MQQAVIPKTSTKRKAVDYDYDENTDERSNDIANGLATTTHTAKKSRQDDKGTALVTSIGVFSEPQDSDEHTPCAPARRRVRIKPGTAQAGASLLVYPPPIDQNFPHLQNDEEAANMRYPPLDPGLLQAAMQAANYQHRMNTFGIMGAVLQPQLSLSHHENSMTDGVDEEESGSEQDVEESERNEPSDKQSLEEESEEEELDHHSLDLVKELEMEDEQQSSDFAQGMEEPDPTDREQDMADMFGGTALFRHPNHNYQVIRMLALETFVDFLEDDGLYSGTFELESIPSGRIEALGEDWVNEAVARMLTPRDKACLLEELRFYLENPKFSTDESPSCLPGRPGNPLVWRVRDDENTLYVASWWAELYPMAMERLVELQKRHDGPFFLEGEEWHRVTFES